MPPEIQEHICTYIEDNLVPDIKSYVKEKYPKIYGVQSKKFPLKELTFAKVHLSSYLMQNSIFSTKMTKQLLRVGGNFT